ncbi:MAG TPA: alpha-ketoacid dehydrogenase subunit beta [Methylomirabilota bacterium]|jgi:pyruvate dehydrogenase E1 component beta subunit|nr:alpha-ketoacid dehydrogenase subunit beta [Methylomirabilota bacterium]
MHTLSVAEAICEGLREEMERDPRVFLMGEDVGAIGGIFATSRGLLDKFGPERIRDTPISEASIVGHAIGAAVAGMRPVVECGGFVDFLALTMDQLVNQAAKLRYMFGGKGTVPIVVRAAQGSGVKLAAQHSQSLEAWFAHVPGLIVVCPSSPADAKGLLLAAIRNPNPVVFLEHKMLYFVKGDVPDGEGLERIGVAARRREGTDVTLVTYSLMAHRCQEAADLLGQRGISCEVLDLRTIRPWDREAVLASARKTHRLVVVHEAVKGFGVGAEIAATVMEEAFDDLDAPVVRLGAHDVPMPFNENLERETVPTVERIVEAVRKLA